MKNLVIGRYVETQPTHTPTPDQCCEQAGTPHEHSSRLHGADGLITITMQEYEKGLRAINAHQEMKLTLESVLANIQENKEAFGGSRWSIMTMIEKAIAKAEGK